MLSKWMILAPIIFCTIESHKGHGYWADHDATNWVLDGFPEGSELLAELESVQLAPDVSIVFSRTSPDSHDLRAGCSDNTWPRFSHHRKFPCTVNKFVQNRSLITLFRSVIWQYQQRFIWDSNLFSKPFVLRTSKYLSCQLITIICS